MNDLARRNDEDEKPEDKLQMETENELFGYKLTEGELRSELEGLLPKDTGIEELESIKSMTYNRLVEVLATRIIKNQVPQETKNKASEVGRTAAKLGQLGVSSTKSIGGAGSSLGNQEKARAKVQKGRGGSAAA